MGLGGLSFLPGAFELVGGMVTGGANAGLGHHMLRMRGAVTVLAVHRLCMPVLMAAHTGNIAVFASTRSKHVGNLLMAGQAIFRRHVPAVSHFSGGMGPMARTTRILAHLVGMRFMALEAAGVGMLLLWWVADMAF
jgi:hypothetical protein